MKGPMSTQWWKDQLILGAAIGVSVLFWALMGREIWSGLVWAWETWGW